MSEHAANTADNVVEQLAEHRLDWDLIRDRISTAIERDPDHRTTARHLGPYVTISRQAGTDGRAIAQRLGEELGWTVLDREIVELIGDIFHLEPSMLRFLDEAKANWVRDVLGDLMPHQIIDRDTYVHHLGQVLHLAGLHGRVVLVGRGANLFLPRAPGMAVRLVGGERQRAERLARAETLDYQAARQRVDELDRQRAHFVERYFGRQIDDPLLYDLILNTSTLSADDVVEIVAAGCRQRGLDR